MRKLLSRVLAVVMALVVIAPMAVAQEKVSKKNAARIPTTATVSRDKKAYHSFAAKTRVKGQENFTSLRTRPLVRLQNPAAAGAPAFAAGSSEFYGSLMYSDDDSMESGIYSMTTSAPCIIECIAEDNDLIFNYGAYYDSDKNQYIGFYDLWGLIEYYYIFDATTWECLESGAGNTLASDVTYDAVTGKPYGSLVDLNTGNWVFGTIDTDTWSTVAISPLSQPYMGVAAAKDGKIYAIDPAGDFGEVNKTTGAFTLIKSTGLVCKYLTSAAIDPRSGLFYYICMNADETSDLYTIDCTTGEATRIYGMPDGEEMAGLYFEPMKAEEGAPDQGTIDALTFEAPSLSGVIKFTAPSTHYDGSKPAAGETLRYEVLANDQVIAQGKDIQYGHTYNLNISVPQADLYTFKVIFYNEVGPSPAAKMTLYVGDDTPCPVTNVVLAYVDGKMTLTWDAVTEGEHAGYVEGVTYNVYNKAGEVVATAITGTTFAEAVAMPEVLTTYQYYVSAVAAGLESPKTASNTVALGNIVPPFTETFDDEGTVADWTIIDSNNDGRTWKFYDGHMRVQYNGSKDMDDWLITPAVKLEEGQYFTVSVDAWASSSYFCPEAFEVYMGTAPTAAGMTTELIPYTELTETTPQTFTAEVLAPADGVYYFGIHGCSPADMFYLEIDNFSLSAPVNGNAPAAATDLTVVTPYSGEAQGSISYVLPTKTVAGNDLESLTRAEILVNDEIISVDNHPTPGASNTWVYNAPASGNYNIKVIAYNEEGAGIPAEINVYLGINVPAAPASAHIEVLSETSIKVVWDQVTTDCDGALMNPALITYIVVGPEGVVADGVTATEITLNDVVPAGEQDFFYFGIYAESEAGMSDDCAVTDMVAVGTPYTTPYYEPFAGGLAYNMAMLTDGIAEWGLFTDEDFADLTSRNNDGGFAAMNGSSLGATASLITGLISITDPTPELSYYWYNIAANDANTIEVEVMCEGETTTVSSHDCAGGKVGAWNCTKVDMSAYAGKTVQLVFTATTEAYIYTMIDDIRLGEQIKYDLAAVNIAAPSQVVTESEFDITYTIENNGAAKAEGYVISLYADGNLVESITKTEAVEVGETYTGTFSHDAYGLFETGTYQFSFVIEWAADEDKDNNGSGVATVKVVNSDRPAVEIAGEAEGNTVVLSWDTPAIDVSNIAVVEDFESASYQSFAYENVGQWTMLNFNEDSCYGINGVSWPGIYGPYGFVLMNTEETTPALTDNEVYAAFDGVCYMAAWAHESGANDAWLISPKMGGEAQTIKFMAKCPTKQYGPETMECYYSTADGISVNDFVKVTINGYNDANGVETEWTEYSFDIPAGAKYFAIRSNATDVFALMIDAIEYSFSSPFVNLELVGYDIYRNGEKINKAPVTGNTYTDTVAEDGEYNYQVVVVYNEGNSAPSNTYSFSLTGISEITLDGAEGIFYNIQGIQVENPTPGNVYIRVADGKATKVYVK